MRIIRACKEMGISDRGGLFGGGPRRAARHAWPMRAICIGPAPVAGELPEHERPIISAAMLHRRAGHPPGLRPALGEREVCRSCARSATSPSSARASEMIAKMGDKDAARTHHARRGRAGCARLRRGQRTRSRPRKRPKQIGFPLLIKARAGGGGRGIRLRQGSAERGRARAYLAASSEAQARFRRRRRATWRSSSSPVKHIEMQLLCDQLRQCRLPGRARMLHAAQKPEDCWRKAPALRWMRKPERK